MFGDDIAIKIPRYAIREIIKNEDDEDVAVLKNSMVTRTIYKDGDYYTNTTDFLVIKYLKEISK